MIEGKTFKKWKAFIPKYMNKQAQENFAFLLENQAVALKKMMMNPPSEEQLAMERKHIIDSILELEIVKDLAKPGLLEHLEKMSISEMVSAKTYLNFVNLLRP